MNAVRRYIFPLSPIDPFQQSLTHLNHSILEGPLDSILIMEDDMDWDARLLTQLPQFATGIRTLSHIPLDAPQSSPYGDDWDILYPGHCGEDNAIPPSEPLHIIYDDPTVVPRSNLTFLHLLKDYPDHTRIIHRGIQYVKVCPCFHKFMGAEFFGSLLREFGSSII
jgi:hypothetical protein